MLLLISCAFKQRSMQNSNEQHQRDRLRQRRERSGYHSLPVPMTAFDIALKMWPIALGAITLIIVLSKLDLRVAVIEEKVKALFEILNRKK